MMTVSDGSEYTGITSLCQHERFALLNRKNVTVTVTLYQPRWYPVIQCKESVKSRSCRERLGCRNRRRALPSIWRIRSRVSPNF